jgi:outer membrane protein assembly factor BamB
VPSEEIRVVWRTPLAGGNTTASAWHHVSADEQNLYALVDGIAAYDLGTGALVWRSNERMGGGANVVTSNGRVFAVARTARALAASTGAELWRFTPDSPAPALSAVDERAFYIGTESSRVYALDVATGEPLWSTQLISGAPYRAVITGVVVHGDSLYVSLVEETSPTGHLKRGWIVGLERYNGRVLWRYVNERAGEAHDAGHHAVAGRYLLVNDLNGGAFLALDRFTGTEIWRRVGPADRFGARDVFKILGERAYLASNDASVYAFDPRTGQVHWRTNIGASASSSLICGDVIFAVAGSLHMLDLKSGASKAALFQDEDGFVQGDAFVVSRLVGRNGRAYFVGYDGVYAVDCTL